MNLGPPTTEEQKRSQVIVFSFLILTFLFFRFNFFFFLFQQDLATVDWFEERLRAPERGFARSAYLQVCFVLFCCVSVFFFYFFFFSFFQRIALPFQAYHGVEELMSAIREF